MFWTDLKRIARSGLKNFIRNGTVAWASVLVITITLSVLTSLLFFQAVLNYSLSQIQDKVDVTVYFTTEASEDKVFEIKTSLEALPEVAQVTYESADEALAKFKERHSNDYLTLQALEELSDNPLGASLNIKAGQTSQYESIIKFFEDDSALGKQNENLIEKINYNQNKVIIDRLTSIIDGARTLGFLITLILAFVSVLITYNTVRLAIFISREEISIMKLVGASPRYIRGPFVIEGIICGVIASLVTLILFYPVSLWLGNKMTSFLGLNLFDYYLSHLGEILLIIIFSGIFLGAISSFFAIRKYLKK
ncbi:MAG: ABC transporter permease [Candidatus Pacebacteria bacterium]|nr:ABC transporter permease [Candidatus Paceibacterota bacterium]MBP9780602.1 ABC transporter permease [Candidatus Paceibacterota bacterium]